MAESRAGGLMAGTSSAKPEIQFAKSQSGWLKTLGTEIWLATPAGFEPATLSLEG